MSVLETLRTRAGILLSVVIGLVMIGFVVEGALTSLNFGGMDSTVGIFNGEKIDVYTYNSKYEQTNNLYKLLLRNANDEQLSEEVSYRVWQDFINQNIYAAEFKKIGLLVSPGELSDLMQGDNLSPLVTQNQSFINPDTRVFDINYYRNFLDNIRALSSGIDTLSPEQQNQIYISQNFLYFLEQQVKIFRSYQKYTEMFNASRYVTQLEAQRKTVLNDELSEVSFVKEDFNTIPDSLVTITKSDLKNYYDKYKERYKKDEESKDIEYILFSITPSINDVADARTSIEKLLPQLKSTQNALLFAQEHSDVRTNNQYIKRGEVPRLDSFAFSGNIGDVSNIYEENSSFRIARIVNKTSLSDSVEVRRIVLRSRKTTASTLQLADSLINAYKQGTPFDTLLHKFSQNPQLTLNGGNIGWITPQNLPQTIFDSCFVKKGNGLMKIKDGGTIQLMQVTGRTKEYPKVKVAEIVKNIIVSDATRMNYHHNANEIVIKATDAEKFRTLVKENNYPVMPATNIRLNDKMVGTIGNAREVVRWVFQNELGSVSPLLSFDNKLVIAIITKETKEGYPSIESIESEILPSVRKEKKGEMIIQKWSGKNSIEDLQAAGKTLQTESGVRFNGVYFNSSIEPKVVGTVSALKVDKTSSPIVGEAGVYVCKVTTKKESSVTDIQQAQQRLNNELIQQQQMRQQQQVMMTMQRSALGVLPTLSYELEYALTKGEVQDFRGKVIF